MCPRDDRLRGPGKITALAFSFKKFMQKCFFLKKVAPFYRYKMDDVSDNEEFHLGIDSESENEYAAPGEEDEGEEDWTCVPDPKRFRSTSSSDIEDAVDGTREGRDSRIGGDVECAANVSPDEREEWEDDESREPQDRPAEDEKDPEQEVMSTGDVVGEGSVPSPRGPVAGASTCFCGGGSRSGMIECGSCGGRYHGDCVGVTRQRAALLQQFHCPSCMSRDPSLVTMFRDEGVGEVEGDREERDDPMERAPGPRKRTSNMCGALSLGRQWSVLCQCDVFTNACLGETAVLLMLC